MKIGMIEYLKKNYIDFLVGNYTVKPINLTDFLVPMREEIVYHMRYVNDSLYLMEEEYLSFEFAAFRGSDLYIKV